MTVPAIPADLFARAQIISGLRQLADYLDANPGVPVSEYGWDVHTFPGKREGDARAAIDRVAAILGVPVNDQTADGGHYTATKTFGRISYTAVHIPARYRAAHDALMSYAGVVMPDDEIPAKAA